MGLFDRHYWKDDQGGGGGFSLSLPRLGSATKLLLWTTIGVAVLQLLVDKPGAFTLSQVLGARPAEWWQVWRYITFQFVHASFMHLLMNMMGLYFLGTLLEGLWGPRRFVAFYLSCGAAAGVLYVAVAWGLRLKANVPLVGASGGIFGILLACAVLMPHVRILLLVFPVSMRMAAIIVLGIMAFTILTSVERSVYSSGFWSQTAHFGGVLAAAVWLWILPRRAMATARWVGAPKGLLARLTSGLRRRPGKPSMNDLQAEQREVDRILDKIHDQGINSLTRKERTVLADASRRQAEEERFDYKH